MKIRFYRRPTIKSYRNALVRFLRWGNVAPHQFTREEVALPSRTAGRRRTWSVKYVNPNVEI